MLYFIQEFTRHVFYCTFLCITSTSCLLFEGRSTYETQNEEKNNNLIGLYISCKYYNRKCTINKKKIERDM